MFGPQVGLVGRAVTPLKGLDSMMEKADSIGQRLIKDLNHKAPALQTVVACQRPMAKDKMTNFWVFLNTVPF